MDSIDNFKKSEHFKTLKQNHDNHDSYKEVFESIFENNLWGSSESRSGPASEIEWD